MAASKIKSIRCFSRAFGTACARLSAEFRSFERHLYRYEAVLLRAHFDGHRDEPDVLKAKKLLEDGEKELESILHPCPLKFPNSPGGVAYDREVYHPDWMLDMWHPLERAQYPEYFKRREQRKLEFIERWEKKYGKVEAEHSH